MRFIKEDNSLWAHDNRSGTIADSFYKQWVDDGKEVDPYVAPPPAPITSATKLSILRELKAAGEWNTIQQAMKQNEEYEDEWIAASTIAIDDPVLLAFQQVLGWTDEQLVALFEATR